MPKGLYQLCIPDNEAHSKQLPYVNFQIPGNTGTISTGEAGTPLSVKIKKMKVCNIIRGVIYTIVFNSDSQKMEISPSNNGEECVGELGVDIIGEPAQNISVNFNLPSKLQGNNSSIAVTFPSSGFGGGVRVDTGELFNPQTNYTLAIGENGIVRLRIGCIFTIPANAGPGEFGLSIECDVQYQGI